MNKKNRILKKRILVSKMSKKIFGGILMCTLIGCMALNGCESVNQKQYQNTGFAMGTVISQNMYGGNEQIAEEVLEVINGLEQTISWRIEGSEVDQINDAAGTDTLVEAGDKLAVWIMDCEKVYEKSGGKLDVTIGPVARLWDIGGENPRIPKDYELAGALKKVDAGKLEVWNVNEDSEDVESKDMSKESGMDMILFQTEGGQLDLGAVGKGIGCDEIYEYLTVNYPGINGTFSVGGSVLIYGEKPNGQPWKIGIRDPRGEEGEYMGSLTFVQEKGEKINVSTSGDYEKYFEQDGVRYHHILDPDTGAPAESDLISVTIISQSGFLSDALSTACFVAGKEKAIDLAQAFNAEAVLITKDKNIVMTEGAEEYFELLSKEYSLKDEKK